MGSHVLIRQPWTSYLTLVLNSNSLDFKTVRSEFSRLPHGTSFQTKLIPAKWFELHSDVQQVLNPPDGIPTLASGRCHFVIDAKCV